MKTCVNIFFSKDGIIASVVFLFFSGDDVTPLVLQTDALKKIDEWLKFMMVNLFL